MDKIKVIRWECERLVDVVKLDIIVSRAPLLALSSRLMKILPICLDDLIAGQHHEECPRFEVFLSAIHGLHAKQYLMCFRELLLISGCAPIQVT